MESESLSPVHAWLAGAGVLLLLLLLLLPLFMLVGLLMLPPLQQPCCNPVHLERLGLTSACSHLCSLVSCSPAHPLQVHL